MPLFVTSARARIRPPARSSMTTRRPSPATSSTASTSTLAVAARTSVGSSEPLTTGSPSTRTAVEVNFGDQSRPPREPLSPGRPTQPVQCSGRRARRTGSSTTFEADGSIPPAINARASPSSSGPRSAPQWTIAGSRPAVTSISSDTPSARRATMTLAEWVIGPFRGNLGRSTVCVSLVGQSPKSLPAYHYRGVHGQGRLQRRRGGRRCWCGFVAGGRGLRVVRHPQRAHPRPARPRRRGPRSGLQQLRCRRLGSRSAAGQPADPTDGVLLRRGEQGVCPAVPVRRAGGGADASGHAGRTASRGRLGHSRVLHRDRGRHPGGRGWAAVALRGRRDGTHRVARQADADLRHGRGRP